MVQEINLELALNFVQEYSEKYRNPNSSELEIGNQYFLFPENVELKISSWPQKWQFCGDGGVYLILDINKIIIYIGETTHFGNRFGSYFGNPNNKCLLKQVWNTEPYSLVQIKVPAETLFERLGLEEFLIKKILPSENIRFKY